MKTWATISPRKKGEILRLVFEKRRYFAQKMNQCCLLAFFFPTKKKKLHHNHPNSIFAHSCECSEYKSTAAIFFRSIGQLTWGLRFRKNPLKLQINSSSIEIRSGAFLFLFWKIANRWHSFLKREYSASNDLFKKSSNWR
jgi:hypothetical protein